MNDYVKLSIEAARKAGALLMKGFGTDFAISEKEGRRNLVTTYDKKSEALILEMIKEEFPEHSILRSVGSLRETACSGLSTHLMAR